MVSISEDDRIDGKQVLAVHAGGAWEEFLLPALRRASCGARSVPDGASGIILASNARFDLVLAEYPMNGYSVVDFLRALRAPGCPSVGCATLLVAPEEQVNELAGHLGRYQVEIRGDLTPEPELLQAIGRHLGIAARIPDRNLVHLEANLDGGRLNRLCQIANLSESGMLLRLGRSIPLGTELKVGFTLPDDPRPIQGRVRVVRQSSPEREAEPGLGVRFVAMEAETRERLRHYLARRGSARSSPARTPPPAAPEPAAASGPGD